ncbi:MAG: hypothetical protein JXM79_13240 [Sedimentisphaerales bacterium]|nr:hypothetical protein [Sedimentisphaerales bacterium]
MRGKQPQRQAKLFCYPLSIEQRIQDLLIATVQYLRILVRHAGRRVREAFAQALDQAAPVVHACVTIFARCPNILMLFVDFWLRVRLCYNRRRC